MSAVLAQSPEWTDRKRWLWLLSIGTLLLPVFAVAWGHAVGLAGWWFGPLFVFGVIPFLDWALGEDASNPPESAVAGLEAQAYYRWAVYLAVLAQFVGFAVAVGVAGNAGLSVGEYLGLAFSAGTASGVAINTAHELGHKTSAIERFLAKLALAPSAYGHFFVEHNRGHHVRVATPEDPASSRLGESFWEFLPRTVLGSLRSAWRLEAERLARRGLPVWSWRNENLQGWSMTVVLWGVVLASFGAKLLPFLLIQAVYGFCLLEVVNYLEHYGLCRRKLDSGRYERCQPQHSWNSNRIVTNLFLYQLQRHSDHHAYPTRSYQSLRHFDTAPQLPSGYASMILLAYFPPLWFRVMDKRVSAHYGGDLSRANVKPGANARA